jgi:hypothetical protein
MRISPGAASAGEPWGDVRDVAQRGEVLEAAATDVPDKFIAGCDPDTETEPVDRFEAGGSLLQPPFADRGGRRGPVRTRPSRDRPRSGRATPPPPTEHSSSPRRSGSWLRGPAPRRALLSSGFGECGYRPQMTPRIVQRPKIRLLAQPAVDTPVVAAIASGRVRREDGDEERGADLAGLEDRGAEDERFGNTIEDLEDRVRPDGSRCRGSVERIPGSESSRL